MKFTIVQTKVYETKERNLEEIVLLLQNQLNTDVIVFPEMLISPYDNESFCKNSVSSNDEFFSIMKKLALKHDAFIIAGSVPEKTGNSYYNTTFIFNNSGDVVSKYRKIHLFEITYPNGDTYKESDVLSKGNELVTVDICGVSIGIMICFDIRFPLLAKALQEKGAKILVVPAAFNQYTGPLHWKLAFRSRAVDNQVYTIGVSPSNQSKGTYEYYGHSIIVNPFGEVLFEAKGDDEIIKTIDIDINEVEEARKKLPILKNKVSF